ncbi:MAG: iron uptake porin [Spirulina sp. SIO3F2]|nr:iron uptake porin [Spirulina sp. SIO3F2]
MVFKNKALQISSAVLATVGLSATAATAQSLNEVEALLGQMDTYESQFSFDQGLGQGVGAAQFSDVSPSDWAYQALDDLVRRYDCLKGYPNGTFRGNRALSRYEFAAGLNACMQQIERLIAETTADFVTRDDLATIQRLMEDFEAELAALGARVDALESRVSFLEDNSFSTTTKLTGEVIVAATGLFSGQDVFTSNQGVANGGNYRAVVNNTDEELTLGYRARLTLNTSFSGKDLLITRLATGNLAAPAFNTNTVVNFAGIQTGETTQTFNLGNNNNNVAIDWVAYYFPVGDSQGYIAANGGIWSDFVPTLNPYFEDYDGGNGALSTFASESPIYRIGGGAGAGFSFNFDLLDSILGPSTITVGYLAGQANDATRGLFSGDYAFLGQANVNISDDIALGLTYVHGYHPDNTSVFDLGGVGTPGVVGTALANLVGGGGVSTDTPNATNSYGAELAWRISDDISFSGFFAYTDATLVGSRKGDAEIWTYGAGLAFPDLGGEGNVLGLFAGAQPYAGSIDIPGLAFDTDETPYHVELFYKYQLSDNISITPGFIWLTAPNQIDNDTIVGTLRTTFTF